MISAQFKKPFAEQLDFFRQKLGIAVADWRDLPGGFNDAAFYAAGAMKADLVADLMKDVDTAIAEGKGMKWFVDNFAALVEKHGWASTNAKFGDAAYVDWRARIVYQTNMATSYAAGRYTQLTHPDLLKVAPYWMYRHNDAVAHPRKWHLAWNRVTKLSTDPWWRTHYTPNGWGCGCYIIAMSKAEAERQGAKFGAAPGEGQTYTETDRNTGEVLTLPVGIDRGWNYAPGANSVPKGALAAAVAKFPKWGPDLAAAYQNLIAARGAA